MHRHANFSSRLPDAAFHHIAGAQFLRGRAHIDRALRVLRGRSARHNAQVGELRHVRDNVISQTVSQRGKVGVSSAVFEGQHRDPEAFIGADGAGVGRGYSARGGSLCRRYFLKGMSRQVAEFVAHVARSLQAMTRILLQTAPNDAGQIAGQIRTHVGNRRWSIAQNRRDQLGRRCSFERPAPGRHLVKHDSERKNIGAVVERAGRCLFRRHVGWRPHYHAHFRTAGRGHRGVSEVGAANIFGKAEVEHLDPAFIRNHDISRLQVAMHDAFLMCRRQRIPQSTGNLDDLLDWESTLRNQAVQWESIH